MSLLLTLSIERLALIEKLQLNFQPGLNVFTGETGAGKSIVLDAIGLLLGNRGNADLIRRNAEAALVEGLFQIPVHGSERIHVLLSEWGIDLAGDDLLISRELHRSGRTVCRINGRMATVQMLRELGERLVQQHGQHDHQGLLRSEEQLRLLDLYAKHQGLLDDVCRAYDAWQRARRALQDARMDEQERIRRLDMLQFQIDEIEKAQLRPGEEDNLRERRQRLLHTDKIASALQTALQALDGTDRTKGALHLIGLAYEQVAAAQAFDAGLQETNTLIDTAHIHVQEASHALSKYLHALEHDPAELESIEARLTQIRSLERKYGATVEDVLDHLENAKAERARLLDFEAQASRLEEEELHLRDRLAAICTELHHSRRLAAERLAADVQEVLRALSMPSARLEILVEERKHADGQVVFGRNGADAVTFLFSANRGEEPKPLSKIASGGELSRTLLALKAVLAGEDDLDTLIFDEIDAGVSGAAAQAVAEQLVRIGANRQVLCVTHSAQIAAAAHSHFCIEKREREEDTATVVTLLDDRGRESEIARLLGSSMADDTAFQHAKALLKRYGT